MNTNLTNLSEIIPRSFIEKSHSVQTRGRIEKTEIIETAIKYLKHVHDVCGPLLVDSGIVGVQEIDPTGSLMSARRSNSQSVNGVQNSQQQSQHQDPLFAFLSGQSKEMAALLMRDRLANYKLGFQESISRVLSIVSDTLQLDHQIMAILHARLEMNKDDIGIEVISRKMMKNLSAASNGVGGGVSCGGAGIGTNVNAPFDVQLRNQYLGHDVAMSLDLEQSRSPTLRPPTAGGVSNSGSAGSSLNALEMISKSFSATSGSKVSSDTNKSSESARQPINKTPSTGGEVYKFKKHIKDRFQNGHQSDVDSGIALGVSTFGSSTHSETLSSAVPSPVDNDDGSPGSRTLSGSSSSTGAVGPSMSPPILVNTATSPHHVSGALSPSLTTPPAAIAAATPTGDDLGQVPILLQNMISSFCANGYGGTGLVPVFALHPSGRYYVLMGISPDILTLDDFPVKPADPNRRIMFPMNVVIDFNHDKRITTESLLERLRNDVPIVEDTKPLFNLNNNKRKQEMVSNTEMKKIKSPLSATPKSQNIKPFNGDLSANRALSATDLKHQQQSPAPPTAHSSAFTVPNLSQFGRSAAGQQAAALAAAAAVNQVHPFNPQTFGQLGWPYPPALPGPVPLLGRGSSPNNNTSPNGLPVSTSASNAMLNNCENFLTPTSNFYSPLIGSYFTNYLGFLSGSNGVPENGVPFTNGSPIGPTDFDSINNNTNSNGTLSNGNNPLNLSNKIKTEN